MRLASAVRLSGTLSLTTRASKRNYLRAGDSARVLALHTQSPELSSQHYINEDVDYTCNPSTREVEAQK